MRLIAEEPSLSDAERKQIVRAVRGDRQLILDIQGASASPHLWTLLASTGVHHADYSLCSQFLAHQEGTCACMLSMDVEGALWLLAHFGISLIPPSLRVPEQVIVVAGCVPNMCIMSGRARCRCMLTC